MSSFRVAHWRGTQQQPPLHPEGHLHLPCAVPAQGSAAALTPGTKSLQDERTAVVPSQAALWPLAVCPTVLPHLLRQEANVQL